MDRGWILGIRAAPCRGVALPEPARNGRGRKHCDASGEPGVTARRRAGAGRVIIRPMACRHTRVLSADASGVAEAAAILRSGGLVELPTEHVDGVGQNSVDAAG